MTDRGRETTDVDSCQVLDAEGKERGRSVTAGKLAVFKTVTTRSMFLPIFPLLIPPVGEIPRPCTS